MKSSIWTRLGLLSLGFCLANAEAAEGMKGVTFSGYAEGGYANTWSSSNVAGTTGLPTTKAAGFLVDAAVLKMEATVSESTKFVMTNAFSALPNSTAGDNGAITNFGGYPNSYKYFSNFTLGGGDFMMSNLAAYIDHKLSDGVHLMVGNMKTPWGMESMVDRWDMATYYYSTAFTATNNTGGFAWQYDLGAKIAISEVIPGTLELEVMDGRENGQNLSPAAAARYSFEHKSGDMSITPVASVYTGRWAGGPKDLGFSGGAMFKTGAIFANAEFVYTSMQPDPNADPKAKVWSVYVEPGMDLGMVTASLKGEYANIDTGAGTGSVNDINIGAALSHTYGGGMRIRLAYQHYGLGGKIGYGAAAGATHVNDVRLLVGAKF